MSEGNRNPKGAGWPININRVILGFLVFAVYADLFCTVFVIPKFQQIYHDLLGNKPLPLITSLAVNHKIVLTILAAVYLVAGVLGIQLAKRWVAFWVILVLTMLALFQAFYTVCVLCMPLISTIDGNISR